MYDLTAQVLFVFRLGLNLHFRFQILKYVKFVHFRMYWKTIIMKEIDQYAFKHLRSDGVNTVILHCDFDPHFQGQSLQ